MTKSRITLSLFLIAGAVGIAQAQSLKDAKVAYDAEQYDKAKEILVNLIDKKPKEGEAYFYLGNIHLINEKVDSAELVFSAGIENAPKEKLNTIGLGIVDLQKGENAAADQKFTDATSKLGRREYMPLYFAGVAYNEAPEPDYNKALDYLGQAREKSKDKFPDILVAMGDAYLGLNQNSQAYVSYRDALNIDEDLVKAKVAQAIITRSAQAYDVAIENLEGVAEEYPNYAPVYRELAETYYRSSLNLEHEEYREVNKKAVEYYKQYMSVAGDNSVEAKTRYADFLVYSGNYDELKSVSEELSGMEGVDAKVYRYLGYIAYNDKDYDKALEYLNTLFERLEEERIISRDYLFAGLSNVSVGEKEKGIEQLHKAIELQNDDDDLLADISEIAFAKYQDKEIEAAIDLFSIAAGMPESDYYYDANYYTGLGEYNLGSSMLNQGQAQEDGGEIATAKEHLERGVKAFDVVLASDKEEVISKYKTSSLYYKALSQLGMDNLQEPEEMQGLFVDAFTKLIEQLKDKPIEEGTNAAFLTDANNYLGYFYYVKGDNEKAKSHFDRTLEINPENEFALSIVEYLE
ncbi:MAG TPA: tetratricopeptide repeat protein [Candidatus Sphingobacterium stercoripullorum]|nr:tetratricopeptide repeat protein [Candidatus Sphingobacterium stercoripullorum]